MTTVRWGEMLLVRWERLSAAFNPCTRNKPNLWHIIVFLASWEDGYND